MLGKLLVASVIESCQFQLCAGLAALGFGLGQARLCLGNLRLGLTDGRLGLGFLGFACNTPACALLSPIWNCNGSRRASTSPALTS